MAPKWTPMIVAMYKYCEPYFTAVLRWRKCDRSLLTNRLYLLETMCHAMFKLAESSTTYEFALQCADNKYELLEEVLPSVPTFEQGADIKVYNNAQSFVNNRDIFQKSGVFFQAHVLKPLSGVSEEFLTKANESTRKSLIALCEHILRLPDSAGEACIMYREVTGEGKANGEAGAEAEEGVKKEEDGEQPVEGTKAGWVKYEGEKVSTAALALVELLLVAKVEGTASAAGGSSSKKGGEEKNQETKGEQKKKQKGAKGAAGGVGVVAKEVEEGEGKKAKASGKAKGKGKSHALLAAAEEEVEWTKDHPLVGTKVAAYFNVPGGKKGGVERKVFTGTLSLYSPAVGNEEELFHILWEDGDEEDYGRDQLEKARELYSSLYSSQPTLSLLSSLVGKKVADYFSLFSPGKKRASKERAEKLYQGEVKRVYSLRGEERVVVEWEDREEEEYSQEEYERIRGVYVSQFETKWIEWREGEPEGEEGGRGAGHLGARVAAYFPLPNKKRRLFTGRVVKYSPPTEGQEEGGEEGELFHILWEDGDEEDYEREELEKARELFHQMEREKEKEREKAEKRRSSKGSKGRVSIGGAEQEEVLLPPPLPNLPSPPSSPTQVPAFSSPLSSAPYFSSPPPIEGGSTQVEGEAEEMGVAFLTQVDGYGEGAEEIEKTIDELIRGN